MLELLAYAWLFGATLVFVGGAMTGEASERTEPLWLLALAASWPIVAFVCIAGMLAILASWLISAGR